MQRMTSRRLKQAPLTCVQSLKRQINISPHFLRLMKTGLFELCVEIRFKSKTELKKIKSQQEVVHKILKKSSSNIIYIQIYFLTFGLITYLQ